MLKTFCFTSSVALAALLAVPGVQAATPTDAANQAAWQACDAQVGDARALCTEDLWFREQAAMQANAGAAKAQGQRPAEYDAAVQACEPQVGDGRALCLEAAEESWPLATPAVALPADKAPLREAALRDCEPLVGDGRALCTEDVETRFVTN